jgi:hypothetical protein
LLESFAAIQPERAAGNKMALDVEVVVDGGVKREVDVNAMRTFDAAPVIRLQSNQHRTELLPFIKWLLSHLISLCS